MPASSALPLWAQYIQACGPTVGALTIALIASFIQYRQWRTANDKLRLDLLEKRLSVYAALTGIFTMSDSAEALSAVAKITRNLELGFVLFPPDITRGLEGAQFYISSRVVQYILINKKLDMMQLNLLQQTYIRDNEDVRTAMRKFMTFSN